jgi:hypothetical protein
MEGVGIFGQYNGYLVHSVAIWYIFGLFGISFSSFGMSYQGKPGNPEYAKRDETLIQSTFRNAVEWNNISSDDNKKSFAKPH